MPRLRSGTPTGRGRLNGIVCQNACIYVPIQDLDKFRTGNITPLQFGIGFWCKVGKLAADCNSGVDDRTDASRMFKGQQFEREIIVLYVRWYVSYKLSSRDLGEVMAGRGISLARTTIRRFHSTKTGLRPSVATNLPEDVARVQFTAIEFVVLRLALAVAVRPAQ
jgi:hypothetical protein